MAFQWASGGNNWKAEPVQTILIKDITTLPEEAPLEQAVGMFQLWQDGYSQKKCRADPP